MQVQIPDQVEITYSSFISEIEDPLLPSHYQNRPPPRTYIETEFNQLSIQ